MSADLQNQGNLSLEELKSLARMDVMAAQEFCAAQPQIDLPLEHLFSGGIYCRQIKMPKGTFVIGKTHKTSHFNFVMSGRARVLMEGQIFEINGPCVFESKAGVKKVLVIEEDMIWITTHATEETDLDKLEQMFVLSDEEEKLLTEQDIKLLLGDQ